MLTGLGTPEEEAEARPLRRHHHDRLVRILAALAGTYVLVSLVQLPDVIHKLWLDSDVAYYGVLGQLYGSLPAGAHIGLGAHAWYEEAAFLLFTHWLPLHKEIWQWFPVSAYVATTAILAYGIARIFGRLSAVLVIAVMCALEKNSGMILMLQPAAHGNSVLAAVALSVTLALVLPRIDTYTTGRLAALALALGVLTGLPLAGDTLALVWCVAPLIVTVALATRRGPAANARRTLGFATAILIVALVSAAVLAAMMKHEGFAANSSSFYTFVSTAASVANIEAIVRGLVFPLGGSYWGLHMGGVGYLALATALLAFAAILGVIVCVKRMIMSAPAREPNPSAPVSAAALHTAFWTTCLIAGTLVIAVAEVNSADTYFARYVLGPYVGLIALLPLLERRSPEWRLFTCLGVALLLVIAIARSVTTAVTPPLNTQTTSSGPVQMLANFARREHVRVGYTTYWDSYNTTWQSDFAVELFPVANCGAAAADICPVTPTVSSWFVPQRVLRTMLVTDSGPYSVLTSPGARLGKPLAETHIGTMTVYVYGYDIASRFAA